MNCGDEEPSISKQNRLDFSDDKNRASFSALKKTTLERRVSALRPELERGWSRLISPESRVHKH